MPRRSPRDVLNFPAAYFFKLRPRTNLFPRALVEMHTRAVRTCRDELPQLGPWLLRTGALFHLLRRVLVRTGEDLWTQGAPRPHWPSEYSRA